MVRDGVLACLLVLCPMMAFYISTWEQYYTGKLTLTPFNGPSDGLVLGASLSFISFLWGPMYWQTTSVTDGILGSGIITFLIGKEGNSFSFLIGRVRNMDLIVLASVFGLVQELSLKMLSVSRKYGGSNDCLHTRHGMQRFHSYALSITDRHAFDCWIVYGTNYAVNVGSRGWGNVRGVETILLVSTDHLALVMVLNHQSSNEAALFLSLEILDLILFVYTAGLWFFLVFKMRVIRRRNECK